MYYLCAKFKNMVGQNIKYLRNRHKLSQHELADKLGVPRTSLSDYERGTTQVSIDNLIKLSDIFKLTIDDLVKTNLSHRDLEIIRNKDLRILAISVDGNNRSNIELVDTKAEAGYLESFADPEYIRDLPKIHFPNIPEGTYRAFEIRGDSMAPMESGSIVICRFIENLTEIKKDRTYVVIGKSEGVVYKRLRPDFQKNILTLISDNDLYLPYTLAFDEIDEVWQYYAHLSFSDTKSSISNYLDDKISDIQLKITEVHRAVVL
jgi:transcriptional regulator with XRE-family HTH domain